MPDVYEIWRHLADVAPHVLRHGGIVELVAQRVRSLSQRRADRPHLQTPVLVVVRLVRRELCRGRLRRQDVGFVSSALELARALERQLFGTEGPLRWKLV